MPVKRVAGSEGKEGTELEAQRENGLYCSTWTLA